MGKLMMYVVWMGLSMGVALRPPTVIGFSADYNATEEVVHLHWITRNAPAGEKFIIQRSLDSTHFVAIGQTTGVGGQAVQHYYFDDPKPIGGKIYYRIAEQDASGRLYYTSAAAINKPITSLMIGNLYVDSTRQVHFAIISPQASIANITLVDLNGKIWQSYLVNLKQGNNLFATDLKHLSPGIYFFQVNDKKGGGSAMLRFAKVNDTTYRL
ncbi:putative secreted protein (Por secretion system target) [Thermoflavifilum aggregans]|uniref:Putative secreted protein (Por secretion system target) n=1 Tax=Thermoflavifilum aggregans TaxID=454188 RepID=A0A2M9CXM0_9BACT|nr:T9SS type A sorting domain-containing protein [Thermoflavifilum aggregans]PJJ76627.1 putative secreted protein (Por secretion system target) [Thermoflavifilum aggregans]